MNQTTAVFFGDSICEGYRAAPGEGWVEQLARLLPNLRVVNSGVSGETSRDALRRFEAAVAAHQPGLVYIQFGLNDASWWCRQVGRPWLTEAEYIANMQDMVSRTARCGAEHILVGTNHPVSSPAVCAPAEPTYEQVVRQYNAALRTALHNEGLTLVDMEQVILTSGQPHTAFLNPDGVHLSAAGNTLYAHTVGAAVAAALHMPFSPECQR